MATFSTIKDRIPFYRLLFVLLIIKAAQARFAIPEVAYIDADFAGYITPAIEWLEKGVFHLQSTRNAVYPLFAAACVAFTGSINTIVFMQHLLALAGVALLGLAMEKLTGGHKTLLSKCLILVTLFILAQNNELIRFEHTLRPEGLLLFFLGAITWCMVKLKYQKAMMASYLALGLLLCTLYLLLPKLVLGCIFLFAVGTLLYAKAENYSRQLLLKAFAISIIPLAILGLNSAWSTGDAQRQEFVAKNFFYVNTPLICDCAEKYNGLYTSEEKSHLLAVKALLAPSSTNPILGYNPDVYQYGPVAAQLDSSVGAECALFYNSIMNKTLRHCPDFLWKKTKQQLIPYFFSVDGNIRVPYQQAIDRTFALQVSYELHDAPEVITSPILTKYMHQVKTQLQQVYFDNSGYFVYKMFGGKPMEYLSILVFVVLCIRLCFHLYKPHNRIDALDVLLILWFLLLIPTTIVHTFDNVRYSITVYPIIPLIVALGLYSALRMPYGLLRDNFKSLETPVKALLIVIALMLGYYGVNKSYDFTQYHLFEPFLQIHPPVFAIPQQKGQGEVRILCLGGSTTANLTLTEEERYPTVLQKKLQEAFPDRKITVLNGGMDWFTAKHSAMYYISYCRNFKPDMVVILHGINDLYRSFSPEGFAYGPYKEDYSHFYGPSINGANPPSFEKYMVMSALGDFISSHAAHIEKNYPVEKYLARPAFATYMKNLAEVVENDGISCYVLTQPALYKEHNSPEETQKCWFHYGFCSTKIRTGKFEYPSLTSMKHAMDAFNQSQTQVALQARATVINADSLIPKTLEYFTDDVHYTAKGANTIADIVFEVVRMDSVFYADTVKALGPLEP